MRCKNCNKEIEECEIFCDDCKKDLKKASSRRDVKELEKLIEDQKKLNDLENTKELVNLDVLIKEELKEEETIENTNIIEPTIEIKEELKEEMVEINPKKSKKKVIIIIVSIILVFIIGILITLYIFNNKEEKSEEPKTIDYEKVITDYGKNAEELVKNYITENNEIPTWQSVSDLITYDKYDVVCEIHNIYSDGSIYLNECKVEDAIVEFSYGEEKEEIKEGKKVSVYKLSYENGFASYLSYQESGSTMLGTITCKTEECSFISAYEKYVIIKEESLYYLYNYETDTMEFGPFNINDEYMTALNILGYSGKLYGIYYNEDGINNIYNVNTNKTLKNIKGIPVVNELYYDPSIMYKYNLVAIDNNGNTDFVNLKSGNVSFTIKETLGTFIEDSTKKIVYILGYTDEPGEFKVYNSNGKLLFDGDTFTQFKVGTDNLLVANNTKFKVYDKDLKLETSSKTYDKVLGIYEDFVVVTKGNDLKILSIEDKEYVTFEDVWNESYTFQSNLSGWSTVNEKKAINITLENNNNYIKYYYIPSTKQSGTY
ncbi:MAG: hypothetical protein IJY25_02645 [Bacilli bacterium]|nr:hypothetical protein [Bacilli bacterium]